MERNIKNDNLKAFLIFMVVLGHSLEYVCGTNGIYGIIRAAIYSFHIPTFVFLSGYLSKFSKRPLAELTITYMVTYVVFSFLLSPIPWGVSTIFNLLYPQILLWYLLCLWVWHILTPALSNIKYILPLTFLIALFIGFFPEADRFLSISRMICLLPFFLAGYKSSMPLSQKANKPLAFIVMVLCITITVIANIYGFIPLKMYEYVQSYSSTNISVVTGILIRGFIMINSFVIIFCLFVCLFV